MPAGLSRSCSLWKSLDRLTLVTSRTWRSVAAGGLCAVVAHPIIAFRNTKPQGRLAESATGSRFQRFDDVSLTNYGGPSIADERGEMKSEIGLQFLIFGRRVARAAAWVAVTMALGMILALMFGRPVAASTPFEATSPGGHHGNWKSAPLGYKNPSVRV